MFSWYHWALASTSRSTRATAAAVRRRRSSSSSNDGLVLSSSSLPIIGNHQNQICCLPKSGIYGSSQTSFLSATAEEININNNPFYYHNHHTPIVSTQFRRLNTTDFSNHRRRGHQYDYQPRLSFIGNANNNSEAKPPNTVLDPNQQQGQQLLLYHGINNSCWSSRCFHSTTTSPEKKKKKNQSHDKYDLGFEHNLKKHPRKFQQNEEILASVYQDSNNNLDIHTIVYLVKECIKMRNKEAAEAAERLVFEWVMKFYQAGRLANMKNNNIFGMAIQAWVTSGHPSSGKRAENLLDKLEEMERNGDLPFPVDAPKYNTVMKAYAVHGDHQNAQAIFNRCKNVFESGHVDARPNVVAWNTLMDAHIKSKSPDAWKIIEKMFLEMQSQYNEGVLEEPPDVHTYNTLLDAYSKSGNPEAWKKAENFFDEMKTSYDEGILQPPTTISYTSIINVFAKSNQPKKAEHFLEEMYKDYLSGNKSAQPNERSFSSVMDAWARSGEKGAAKRCEKILNRMIKVTEEKNLPSKPTTVSYSTVIIAYAREGQPGEAERVFQLQYEDFKSGNKSAQPDTTSFNSVVDAWARSGEKGAAKRCENILNRMIKVSEEKSLPCKPDTVSYTTVIIAYAREGQPREAERVLQMQYEYFKLGNKRASLNSHGFSAIIHGWAKAKEDISGERAELILSRMLELHKEGVLRERPDAFTYNAIINAWAVLGKADKAKQVFDGMMDDFKKGNKRAKPTDAATFGALMQAYSNANLPDAGELADELLEQMKEMKLNPTRPNLIQVVRCWRCSLGHHPKAEARVKELNTKIDSMK